MPTFSNIDGEESATVTFTVDAVQVTQNSSAVLREILVLGDPEVASSLGLARITNTAPASTNAALNVRIASGPSSVADLTVRTASPSTYADVGIYRVQQSSAGDLLAKTTPLSTLWASSAGFHFDSSGAMTVNAGVVAGSTDVTAKQGTPTGSSTPWAMRLSDGSTWVVTGSDYLDGSTASNITGPALLFDNGTNATMRVVSLTNGLPVNVVAGAAAGSTLVTVRQSTAADLNVTVAGYSTIAAVSSVAGRVGTMPFSTVWASSAGFHFDSSGALQVAASFSGSTDVTAKQGVPTGSSTPWAMRLSDGSTWVVTGTDYVDGSTASNITGPVLLFDNGTNATLRVVSLTNGLPVNVVAGAAAGSTLVTVRQSTAADLNVTVAGYSTIAAVSSVAGIVAVRPSDTNWATSGGFHFDSSGALQVAASFSGSTDVKISSGVVQVQAISSSGASLTTNTDPASTAYALMVRQVGFTTTAQVSSVGGIVAVRPSDTNWATSGGFHFDSSGALQIAGTFSASTTVNVSSLAGLVTAAPVSASGVSMSTDTAPASTVQGLIVRQVGLSTMALTVHNSTIGDLLASVQQNSSVWQIQAGSTNWPKAAGLSVDSSNVQNVKLDGSTALTIGVIAAGAGRINIGSTATENVVISRSSAADQLVTAYQSSYGAFLANVHNSTIGDLLASVQQNSTVWQTQAKIQDSSGVSPNIVGTRPTTGAQGIATREILNDLQSTCFSTQGNNSTSNTVVSSVANQRVKVYAYSITSTAQAINTLSFASSLANPIWQVQMQAISSGITGANLAVSPPAWLFGTAVNEPLVFKVTGTTGTYHLSFSYFVEA